MDSSSEQQQEMSSNTLENMLVSSKAAQQDPLKPPRPHPEHALKCPRCDSTNTKFCYYNNYSLSQPRYFCKSCRRYWTKGGTLRNVPVGGGCRKNRRSSPSCSSSATRRSQDNPLVTVQTPLSRLSYGHDQFSMNSIIGSAPNHPPPQHTFLDALRCGFLESQSPSNFHSQLYYGNYGGGGQICEQDSTGEMAGMTYGHEMGSASTTATTTAVTVTTMKQEMCSGGAENNNRNMLCGFPWQMNGDIHDQSIINNNNININNMGSVVDSGRESWNGFAPSWHGLLNSPLM